MDGVSNSIYILHPCVVCNTPTKLRAVVEVHPPGRREKPYKVWNHICSLWCLVIRNHRSGNHG